MKALASIHLALHSQLTALPSLDGLSSLKSLSLALLPNVKALPPFTTNGQIQSLEIIALPSLKIFPDLAPLTRLTNFVLVNRGMMCCNGFLGSACDLNHPFCQANAQDNVSEAVCLDSTDFHASDSTQKLFHKFASSVCVGSNGNGSSPSYTTQPAAQTPLVNICESVAYRRCPLNAMGELGICVSVHMTVIECVYSPLFITVRRRQIERGIGAECDPIEGSWLGCNRTV